MNKIIYCCIDIYISSCIVIIYHHKKTRCQKILEGNEVLLKKRKSIVLVSSFLMLFCLVFMSFFAVNSKVVQAEQGGNIVLGYYSSWNPPQNLDANKLTHINYAFADVCWEGMHGNPDNEEIPEGEVKTWPCRDLQGNEADIENGSIVLYDYETDLVELPKLKALKKQNENLKTLISIGGWTLSNNLSLVASTEETRENFAESAVEFVREFKLDGLDLDWEYPVAGGMPNNERDPSDKENHTLLLQEVRDAFDEAEQEDNKEYLVTIAGSATWAYADNNELGAISEIVDYMAIMAYDINGTWSEITGHNAPLYYSQLEADVRGWSFGVDSTPNVYSAVPKDKLLLGLPFYGHSWAGCNADNDGKMVVENGAYQTCAPGWQQPGVEGGTVNYNVVKSLINQDGYNYFFDNEAKVPYLYNEQKGEFISYDNVESLGYKVNFIEEQGLGGAMIWDLAGDDQEYNLLKTVSHGLGVSSEAPEPDPIPELEVEITDAIPVLPGGIIHVLEDGKKTGVQVQLPTDLPEGTKLSIKHAENLDKLSGLKQTGPAYTFAIEYPEGNFISEEGFQLTFPFNDEQENQSIYSFNSVEDEWEKNNSKIENNQIRTTVDSLATHGLFAMEDEEDPKDDNNDEDNNKEDDGNGKDKDDGDVGGAGNPADKDKQGDDGGGGSNGGTVKGSDDNKTPQPNTNNKIKGTTLPDTATNLYNYLTIGISIILIGSGILFFLRKRKLAMNLSKKGNS